MVNKLFSDLYLAKFLDISANRSFCVIYLSRFIAFHAIRFLKVFRVNSRNKNCTHTSLVGV